MKSKLPAYARDRIRLRKTVSRGKRLEGPPLKLRNRIAGKQLKKDLLGLLDGITNAATLMIVDTVVTLWKMQNELTIHLDIQKAGMTSDSRLSKEYLSITTSLNRHLMLLIGFFRTTHHGIEFDKVKKKAETGIQDALSKAKQLASGSSTDFEALEDEEPDDLEEDLFS